MIEQNFQMTQGDKKTIEKVIVDENVNINHMILGKGEGLPEHFSNSNVYMTVIRGLLSIGLDKQKIHEHPAGTILKIPEGIKMNVKNLHDDTLELIVVKAPAPGK
ncbi:cupin domain-containing protein [Proteiniphilum sp. UBA5431]|jgi:quercetin dioxygenase-like cupin family protein|uniref:cupin domain-containing protein n=1 Tax=Proteiniphilum sp. UBA5431 TaxID=1947280 RepID=UPI00257B4EC6|nr:cupin domain-containing protein [Proteiniphilum sp. UBA5431]